MALLLTDLGRVQALATEVDHLESQCDTRERRLLRRIFDLDVERAHKLHVRDHLPKFSAGQIVQEALTATGLVLRGRIPLFPKRIKRLKNFQRMVKRIIPIGEPS